VDNVVPGRYMIQSPRKTAMDVWSIGSIDVINQDVKESKIRAVKEQAFPGWSRSMAISTSRFNRN